MSTESSRQFIERYIRVMSGGEKSPESIAQYVTDESLKQHLEIFEAAFPGYALEVHDVLADGDRVALRATFRGLHSGDFQGIPPTGREVSAPLTIIYRIQDRKIAEHWLNADVLSLLQQLGAAPVPA
jgi:predicted ester cyclase